MKKKVSKVIKTNNEISVYISISNENLDNILRENKKRKQEFIEFIKNFYIENICFYSILLDLENILFENISEEKIEDFKESVLKTYSKSICNIIDEYKNIFSTELEN
ncbi:hypothetical protein [Thermobrachium celere]|uniref:hypothetical protein n=1 Tax=Thermobrachium celere TaxID=53422 RepID=UPI00194515A7|nr:hypothetical protein [Thermobrachium celere]